MHFAAWVLILLCAANFISISAHESKDFLISSNKLSLSDPEEEHDFGTSKVEASDNISFRGKAGKGAHGGANVVHHRPGDKSAALFYKPRFSISCMILGYGFFLFFAFASRLS